MVIFLRKKKHCLTKQYLFNNFAFIPFFKIYFIFERQREGERKRNISPPIHHFPVARGAEPVLSQELEVYSGFHTWLHQPKYWRHPLLPSQTISRELGWKWNGQGSNQCLYGIPAPQVEAQLTVPWCQALLSFLTMLRASVGKQLQFLLLCLQQLQSKLTYSIFLCQHKGHDTKEKKIK